MPDLSVKTIADVPVFGVYQGPSGDLWRKVSEREAEPISLVPQTFLVNPDALVVHIRDHPSDVRYLEQKLQLVRRAIHHAEQQGNGNISSQVLREAIGFYD